MAKIKVNVTLDEELMRRVDEYAEENYLNRSSLVSLATTQFLNAADVTKAIRDMAFAMRKIADNGEIDDEQIALIAVSLSDAAETSGLVNVSRRLQHYADGYGKLEVARSNLGGLRVTIRLNIEKKEDAEG